MCAVFLGEIDDFGNSLSLTGQPKQTQSSCNTSTMTTVISSSDGMEAMAKLPPESARAREILDSMREQRESFLASIHLTEAEAASSKKSERPLPQSLPAHKPPLFSPIEAERITKRLNASIQQRKERLARFSTSADYKFRSGLNKSDYSFRKVTHSPLSVTTASTEDNTFSSVSSPHEDSGYDSDASEPLITKPTAQYPLGLEGIKESNHEESESDRENYIKEKPSSRGKHSADLIDEECSESEVGLSIHSYYSESGTERTSKPASAPLLTLFGYTSFDEGTNRPPLLVHCPSSSPIDQLDEPRLDEKKKPSPVKRESTCETVVSGLSTTSEDDKARYGPLGLSVEARKKKLLRKLNSHVKKDKSKGCEEENEDFSSIASANQYIQRTESSSVTDIGISSASSYSFSSDGSETSGWESKSATKASSLEGSFDEDSDTSNSLHFDTDDRMPSSLEISIQSTSTNSSYDFENPLGELQANREVEPKLLFTPPDSKDRKRLDGKKASKTPSQRKTSSPKSTLSSGRVSFHSRISVRMRTPDPEEFEDIIFPRGNLWNIAKTTGIVKDGPIKVDKKSVFRSSEYVHYSAEHKCTSKGGHFSLALTSGMPKTQYPVLRKLKVPRVNGKKQWKLKARGGLYHMAVWTRLSNNVQSPASIFRSKDEPLHTYSRDDKSLVSYGVEDDTTTLNSEIVHYANKLRRAKRNCGAKGSFHYLSKETNNMLSS